MYINPKVEKNRANFLLKELLEHSIKDEILMLEP